MPNRVNTRARNVGGAYDKLGISAGQCKINHFIPFSTSAIALHKKYIGEKMNVYVPSTYIYSYIIEYLPGEATIQQTSNLECYTSLNLMKRRFIIRSGGAPGI